MACRARYRALHVLHVWPDSEGPFFVNPGTRPLHTPCSEQRSCHSDTTAIWPLLGVLYSLSDRRSARTCSCGRLLCHNLGRAFPVACMSMSTQPICCIPSKTPNAHAYRLDASNTFAFHDTTELVRCERCIKVGAWRRKEKSCVAACMVYLVYSSGEAFWTNWTHFFPPFPLLTPPS